MSELIFTYPWGKEPWGDEIGIIADDVESILDVSPNDLYGSLDLGLYISITDSGLNESAGFVVPRDKINEFLDELERFRQ